jgi:outer membrane protein assembly factor BamA
LCRVRVAAASLFVLAFARAGPVEAQDLSCGPGSTEVRRLQFIGNYAFDATQLADAIVTTPSSWIQRVFGVLGTRRCLDRVDFPRDRLRLMLLYLNTGYPDVQVDTVMHAVRPNVVDVTFRIHEGKPIRIDSLTILGLDSLRPVERRRIERGLPVRLGGPFDKHAIGASIDTLTQRLRNDGFPFADVLQEYSNDKLTKSGRIQFTVRTGARVRIGRVLVTVQPRKAGGKQDISNGSVASAMGIKPGHLYKFNDLVAAQRALIQTDAFQHIRVAIDSQPAPGAPDTLVDVHADVVEGYMHTARLGAGWVTLDCFRTQGEYGDRDFLGGLDFLRLTASVTKLGMGYPFAFDRGLCPQWRQDIYSDTLNYNVSASLQTPVLFGLHLNPTATLFSQRHSEYNAYVRSTPIGTTLTLTRQLTSSITVQPDYQFEYGRTFAQPALYCAVFNLCQPQDVAPLQELLPFAYGGVIAVQDRRDNRDDPHAGTLVQAEGRVGSRFLGSSARLQFDRMDFDAAGYLGAPDGGVLATHLRFGAVVAQGQEAGGFIPPQERLYAGGPTTVRGFVQNELGPVVYIPNTSLGTPPQTILVNGDTVYRLAPGPKGERVVPEGGNWSVVANIEYRSTRFVRGLLQWAAFADAGQVWNGTITGIHGLLWTPGLGIRAYTPVGPIRVDVGYNPYLQPVGAAYFNAAANPPNEVPLYCVSPGNTIPVHTIPVVYQGKTYFVPEQEAGISCPATYRPQQSQGFFHQLTFNISIGQAF